MDNSEHTLRAPAREMPTNNPPKNPHPLLQALLFIICFSPAFALGAITFQDEIPAVRSFLRAIHQPIETPVAEPDFPSNPELIEIRADASVPDRQEDPSTDLAVGEDIPVVLQETEKATAAPIVIYDDHQEPSNDRASSANLIVDPEIAELNSQHSQQNADQAARLQQQLQHAKFDGLSLASFSSTLQRPGFEILNDIGNIEDVCILDCAPKPGASE